MGLTLKQAGSEARQMLRVLRSFEKVEEVLNAAVMAEQAEAGAQERTRVLEESAGKWEVAVEDARVQYAADHATIVEDMERQRDEFAAGMAQMKLEGDTIKQEHDTALEEALTAGQKKLDVITAQCRALEEQRETLEGKLKQAQFEYAAMLDRLGVTGG